VTAACVESNALALQALETGGLGAHGVGGGRDRREHVLALIVGDRRTATDVASSVMVILAPKVAAPSGSLTRPRKEPWKDCANAKPEIPVSLSQKPLVEKSQGMPSVRGRRLEATTTAGKFRKAGGLKCGRLTDNQDRSRR
jgi:hypothetical protein